MSGEIEDVLDALNRAEVRYVVVGGVAVVLHGHLRTTADLDLVVQLDPENATRALHALEGLGYRPRAPVPAEGFADAATRERWIRDKNLVVFSFHNPGRPGFEVDLFAREPFDFEPTFARAVQVRLDRTEARVLALPDLIAMKEAGGRARDLDDIEALRAIQRRSERESERG